MVAYPKEKIATFVFFCVAKVSACFFVSNTHKINFFMGGSPFLFFGTKLAARLPSSGAYQ